MWLLTSWSWIPTVRGSGCSLCYTLLLVRYIKTFGCLMEPWLQCSLPEGFGVTLGRSQCLSRGEEEWLHPSSLSSLTWGLSALQLQLILMPFSSPSFLYVLFRAVDSIAQKCVLILPVHHSQMQSCWLLCHLGSTSPAYFNFSVLSLILL